MITERLIRILEENDQVPDWKIEQVRRISTELFYVGKKLETSRRSDTTGCEVVVYTDQEAYRGMARFTVYDHMSDVELEEKVRESVYAASFVKNPYFELPGPVEGDLPVSSSNLRDQDPADVLEQLTDAVFSADLYEYGSLSASEFFLTRRTVRILNSRGIDLTHTDWSANVEVIPAWEEEGREAEVYHMLRFESLDPEAVKADIQQQIGYVKARAKARNLGEIRKMGGLKVILQDEEAGALLKSFGEDLSYEAKYNHVNHTEIGEDVQKGKSGNVSGSRIQLKRVPVYPGCTRSAAFDRDGVVLKEICLIRDGIAVNRFGDYRNGRYLGIENPTGLVPVTVVEEGTKSFAEMTKEPYVRCVKWSGIQIDRNSGYFGGEVRLGFYFDGEKEIPVTGFTVSGNLERSRETFVFSKETVSTEDYHGPKYIEIRDMDIL